MCPPARTGPATPTPSQSPSRTLSPILSASAPAGVPDVVLDTNVWIDILIFDDPRTRPIHDALVRGTVRAVLDAPCRDELLWVLDYPQFARFGRERAAAPATLAALGTVLPVPTPDPLASAPPPLPACSDRDDQKFLSLAQWAGADWLISKDRALLKLARRIARDFEFRIGEPATFIAAWSTPGPAIPPATRARSA